MLRLIAISAGALVAAFAATGGVNGGPIGESRAQPESLVRIFPAPVADSVASIQAASAPSVVFSLAEPDPADAEAAPGDSRPEGRSSHWAAPARVVSGEVLRPEDDRGAAVADEPVGLRFPNREEWEEFSGRLTLALAAGSLERLMALETEAKAALAALRAIPGHVEYADWLQDRLDDIEVAHLAAELDRSVLPRDAESVPLYEVWLEWMRDRAAPARAETFVPRLKPIFIAAQLPPALVWLAETESSFNPAARSPAGARGLFQLMPETARELGLRLHPYDERLDPVRCAESAARYLAQLQGWFHDWPLVLAAYNAGPTRVRRLLKERSATSFAEIVDALPVETQLYVPRVLATLAIREGLTPAALVFTRSALMAE